MKRFSRRAVVLGAAAFSALGLATSLLADTNSILLQTGISTAPGAGGGTVFSLNDFPAINSSGQVAVMAGLSGSSDGASYSLMRVESSGTLTGIARSGQSAPGNGGGILATLNNATINSSGQVMAFSNLSGTSDGSAQGFFRGDGNSALVALLRQKSPSPGTGTIEATFGWSFGDTGAVTAKMGISGSTATEGIFQADSSAVTLMARQFQPAPGAGAGTFSTLDLPTNNGLGHAAFFSSLSGTNNGSSQGLFRFAGGLSEIARNGQAAPGGGTLAGFVNIPSINNAGQVGFASAINGAPDGASNAIFRGNGTSTVAIARHNQAAPGGGVFGGIIGMNDLLMNNAGQVLFQSPIASAPDGSLAGIFRGDGNSLDAIARAGQAMPGGVTLSSFGADMALTSGGAALYTGFLGNLPPGSTDDRGLYLSDGRETVQVVRKGQSLSSSTVSSFIINRYTYAGGFNAVNDAGQVAYIANLADGSTTIVKFTPTLHYRSGFGGGNWDAGDNWTLGINPSQVHDVMIDPQFGGNVNGPASSPTVASLYVGGKENTATLSLNGGGTLSAGNTTVKATGSINVSNGRFNSGQVTNDGFLGVSVGGVLSSTTITNQSQLYLAGQAFTGNINNFGTMTVSHASLIAAAITNYVGLNIDQATVTGGAITNEVGAAMTARGNISNIITNRGTLDVSGLLTASNLSNSGLVTIDTGEALAGSISVNTGTITLSGGGITANTTNSSSGIIQGGGGISGNMNSNNGLILANSLTHPLVFTNFTTNNSTGRIRVANGSTLNLSSSFGNSGTITLLGNDATFNLGGNLSLNILNNATVSGAGTIGGAVSNSGTLRAEGGTLLITGQLSNTGSTGLIQVSDGATLLLGQGMFSNSNTINVTNGSFINNTVSTFTNNGKISGYGTFTASNWTNGGTMTFTGGFSTINGNVTNQSTRKIEVANNPALFTGNVSNFGIFKNTHTSITFGGTYTESGTFISDPADNFFSDVSITDTGAWVGGVGDRFFLTGNLLSTSAAKESWQTAEAELRFIGGGGHTLSVTGADLGKTFDGYLDNFAWGALLLGAGDHLSLQGDGGALYVHKLLLSGGLNQIASIGGNGQSIYYDLGDPANSYLGGQSYSLAGGGSVSPVPEPATLALAALGAVMAASGRRRAAKHAATHV